MRFSEFRRQHAGFIAALAIIAATMVALDVWMVDRRKRYEAEIERLRAGMSDFERRRSDAVTNSRERQLTMVLALLRRQAKWDADIHLAVAVDSGRMYLEREGATLREFSVDVGPERRIGTPPDTVHLAIPRGTRSVQHVVGASDVWEVPQWVYDDRRITAPADRKVTGALGPSAIVLDGGTIIYAMPDDGPLDDSTYVMPGSIRARPEDLRAIVQNLTPGTSVYFY
ncbi:MAG TPA: hypothetical protein VEI06_15080 [Gemmatimonadaceae bacterium]|nr:hypothetical protein [Gemmatimonadaceae bacterium]